MVRISKARKLFKLYNTLYKRKGKRVLPQDRAGFEQAMEGLDQALVDKDRQRIDTFFPEVEKHGGDLFHKTFFDYLRDSVVALVFALIVALFVRQMWFEPMEIPSGSMRPTFQELDRLTATKTTFGLNIPAYPGHFFFNPSLVKRTGVFIFTSEDMDIPNQDTMYFFLFPGKRRLIKRCMGLPGDHLYFYGGKVYGIDKDGNDLDVFLDSDWMKQIESVPFIAFDGKVTTPTRDRRGLYSPAILHQFNQEIAKLTVDGSGQVVGEMVGTDIPYSELYGMKNYAMCRLLTKAEVARFDETSELSAGDGVLYLELRHTPNLTYPAPVLGPDMYGRIRPHLVPNVSVIPLDSPHLDNLFSHMTTSRFFVDEGRAIPDREGKELYTQSPYRPFFKGVPNGRYEFQDGVGFEVLFGGIQKPLADDHPLMKKTPENIQNLFNIGVEMNTLYAPHARDQVATPARFAYFRHGDLYVMGGPVLQEGDATLTAFTAKEHDRAAQATPQRPYIPFIDHGEPTRDEIMKFGLTVPEKGYLALGDNYAGSADSRDFGFVPANNLRGTPSLIIWPPGPRWGPPAQAPYRWLSPARVTVWLVALCCTAIFYTMRWSRNKKNQFRRL